MLLYMQYLESARPLMEDKEYEEMEQLVLEFQVRVCVCMCVMSYSLADADHALLRTEWPWQESAALPSAEVLVG